MILSIIDFEKLAEFAEDEDKFCIVCLRIRHDVPVNHNCCYECGGGKEVLH